MNGTSRVGMRWVMGMVMVVSASGCVIRFSQRSPWDVQQLQTLSDQLEQFRTLAQLQASEADQLRQAKAELEQRLRSEIASKDISVGYDERGLVVRVLDRVLFDSGKAKLRPEALPVLGKVATVLKREAKSQPVGVEGHTDNQPIKHSGWKNNEELSIARARSVLTYLVQEQGVDASHISAIGHGDERPIASNDTAHGRRLNRRVEIVVLPQGTPKPAAQDEAPASEAASEYHK